MEITYLGHSAFEIKGQKTTLVTDPFTQEGVGFPFPSLSANIVLSSHAHGDHNNVSAVKDAGLTITMPGEYEFQEVRITGFPTFHDKKNGEERGKNTMYKIEIDGISILHAGDLGHTLSDELKDDIGTVHILLVPCGGHYTIGPEEAVKTVRDLEPSIVIPMHYQQKGLDPVAFADLVGVEEFTSKLAVEVPDPVKKLKISKQDLTEENLRVIIMER